MRGLAVMFAITALGPRAGTVPVSSPRLMYATYVGTGRNSVLRGLAADFEGYSYVAATGPAVDGKGCGYLSKLNQTGTAAVWSTCLSVTEVDGLVLDSAGFIYVIGTSHPFFGNGLTFPPGAPSTVIKLAPDGATILFSTQIPGATASVIAVDSSGAVYVAGKADQTFQTTAGAYSANPLNRGFAAKLNPDGSVAYATYLGTWSVAGIAVDSMGQAWIAGTTCGDVTCSIVRYGTAAAILKLDAMGTKALVSRGFGGGQMPLIGGGFFDAASSVAVDSSDAVWVGGSDMSLSVPTTSDGIQPTSPQGPGSTAGYAIT